MVGGQRTVVIAPEAKKQLRQAYLFIRKQSFQNAEMVQDVLIKSFRELEINPERHPPDKYKIDNDGSFRAYELLKFRVCYRITTAEIKVLRIRHTKMNPLEY